MEEKVSIVIPAWNTSNYINHAIESCLNQQYSELEIIVVDDGSTDNTCEVVSKYVLDDSRVRLESIVHGGVSEARNHGIKIATGEYIAFLDSDDWLEPEAISTIVNYYKEYSDKLISCNAYYVKDSDDGLQIRNSKSSPFEIVVLTKDEAILSTRSNQYHNSSINKVYRTRVIRENKIWFDTNISYGEDWLFTFEYLLHTDGMVYLNLQLWNIYSRLGSATRQSVFSSKLLTSFDTVNRMIKFEQEYGYDDVFLNSLKALEVDTAIGLFKMLLMDRSSYKDEYLAVIREYMHKYYCEYAMTASIYEKLKLIMMMNFPFKLYRFLYTVRHH